jgi:signal transduction histidine kinase
VVGVLGIIYDITDLVLAKKQAEIMSQLKSEFVQNMQHDIRTPTSGMWSGLQMLIETEEDPGKQAILILLRDSAKQLFDICNEIIDFDKIERSETLIFSKPIDIRKILSNVIDLNGAAAYQKKLKLSFDVDDKIPKILKGDEYRISRTLINLVSNAVKFTETGSVHLLAKLLSLTDKQAIVQLEVHDTGPGILDEKKEFIYEEFARGDASNRGKYQGSGLGLNIVKQFVAELNGRLEVNSAVGKGTIFYVRLTLERVSIETALEDE